MEFRSIWYFHVKVLVVSRVCEADDDVNMLHGLKYFIKVNSNFGF